ncbi:MAG TPA: hypothetical protein VFB80_22435 [Pirellulaceae bacterium]|nr:hypothetical protein [Pirellulaceae bacterium]
MRLTLRTMLAYQDNVLEPADAEALSQKINESDFASGLSQRIRGVMKKLRMDAPKLDGKGLGNDANTVAEYLDSALPQDRVGDFERVCLESDKHLCEVAACHQILTLVLGKPADVSPELRERVYDLSDPERQAARSPGVGVTPPPVQAAVAANGKPADSEVPDYLRAGRRAGVLPFLATIAATFLIAAFVLRMMGPFNASHPVLQWMRGGPIVAANTATNTQPTPDQTPPESVPAPPGPEMATPPAADSTKTPASPPATPATTPDSATPPAAVAADSGDKPPPAPLPASPPETPAATPIAPAPAAPMPEAVVGRRPLVPAVPAVEPPPMDVGRYTSDGQVLASFDPADGLWKLKPSQGALVAGERVIALPTYRPQLTLPGLQVTFASEGAVQLAAPSEGNIPRLIVDQGKMLIVAVGAMNSQFDLDLGGVPLGTAGIRGLVTLVDPDSTVAVKVMRWLPPGTDPAEGPGATVVELFNTHGRVTWQEQGQPKVEIPTHQVLLYAGASPPELQGPFIAPEWIDAKSVPPIDRQASLELDGMLADDRALSLALQEALQFRKVEVRSLAARCLTCLSEYEPALKEFSDERQKSYWIAEVEGLQRALHHSPEAAAGVKAAVERLRPAEAKDLYRLLWGYSQEQLERGGAAQLVKFLEHEQMDVRVLAYANLLAITGAGELYRPERLPAQQRAAIQNWKERQAKGTIAYKLPPTPLENYKPLANPAATEIPLPGRGVPAAPLAP